MRLDLTELQYLAFIDLLNRSNLLDLMRQEGYGHLIVKLQSFKRIKRGNKGVAAGRAREALQQKTRKKVQEAIDALEREGKKVTAYQIAKTKKVSYNTARKYLEMMREEERGKANY